MEKTQEQLQQIYSYIKQFCEAIYQGGSRVDPVIDNAHDYDYICFAKPLCRIKILRVLRELGINNPGSVKRTENNENLVDFSQIRVVPYTQITWFSYLDNLMIKKVGNDICPKTDIIKKYRSEFLQELKIKADKLYKKEIKNQKRWYHILRGVYILLNNSYEVNDDQRKEINILHDLTPGWEQVRDKTIQLLSTLED